LLNIIILAYVNLLISVTGSSSAFLAHEVEGEWLQSLQSSRNHQPPITLPQYQSSVSGPALMPHVEQKQRTLPQKYTVLPPITSYAVKPVDLSDNVQRVG